MRDGWIRVAAATPAIRVADCEYNTQQICDLIDEAYDEGAKILVLPELAVTGYTCQDLFLQEALIREAQRCLREIIARTQGMDMLVFVGLPWEESGKLYNVAAAISDGELLGLVPKHYLPNYSEYYEARHFTAGCEEVISVIFDGEEIPFGMNQLFTMELTDAVGYGGVFERNGLKVAAELCEDLWAPCPPSVFHALAGADIIVNLSASVEVTGKSAYRESLVSGQSARLICGYIYASAGEGESSQDLVFGGQRLICENGITLANSGRFSTGLTFAEIDVARLRSERRRMTTYECEPAEDYQEITWACEYEETPLERHFDPKPFVPSDAARREERCSEILTIQALGLKKRLEHVRAKNVVIGISGGLDSTLALLVAGRAFDLAGLDRSGIQAVTMPAFGTTDRTHSNALALAEQMGCTCREVNISEAVTLHFRDIGHDPAVTDVTYENSQARERTQVLMDIANQMGGLVIGTGDMSELALGWATYNGDHMSMYGVNCGVPKTLVRHLVRYCADVTENEALRATLLDVLDTPVSPELLPPKDGEIAQITEDLVGPYELHDFFLYHMLRSAAPPRKILRMAVNAFDGTFDEETILKWLKVFCKRFFAQQFKRSCLPDGPKVGSVALSPRGDLRMPSDAQAGLWLRELDGNNAP